VTFIPSSQQAHFYDWVDDCQGSAIVNAVAGSGKTTTLVHGLDLMPGDRFFGAYNKAIADEIARRAPQERSMNVGTFHSMGNRAWRSVANPKLDANKVRNIFREASDRHVQYKPFEGAVCNLVSLAKQAGLGALVHASNENWVELVNHFGIEPPATYAGGEGEAFEIMLKLASKTMKKSIETNDEIIDFDDMIFAPIYHDVPFPEFDWVLVDEAQDTNATRRYMALRMLKPNGRLVAVGDPHQAIYGFTGADSDALDLIAEPTNALWLPLTVTYRCPKSVVVYAQQWVSHIQAHDSAPEGEVIEAKDDTPLEVLVKPGDAVLCRFTAPLVTKAYTFIAAGIPARIEGREIGDGLKALATRWKTDSLSQLEGYLTAYCGRESIKFIAKGQDSRAAALQDKVDCLMVLCAKIKEGNRHAGVESLLSQIDKLFGPQAGPAVTFSTIHKSKGREWDRVVWLTTKPSPWAKQDWQKQQEDNLCYVAATRAKQTLVLLPAA
jgi:superfamily I DNA/RNA helicase